MKQIKKLSLSNVISKLTRNELRNVMAGSGSEEDDGNFACKPPCAKTSSSKDCCSKMAVSGNYPPCGGDNGLVCL